jgi:alpha-beta hydrolase superfamily lysophospholipase
VTDLARIFLSLILLAASVFAIAAAALFLTRDVRFRRRMRRMARSPIASAPRDGLVKISGRLRGVDVDPAELADFDVQDETGVARVRARGEQPIFASAGRIADGAAIVVVGHASVGALEPASEANGYRAPSPARLAIRPIFIALVAACAMPYVAARPPASPESQSTSQPSVDHRVETFKTDDGVELFAQSWRPIGDAAPKAIVIIVHGLKDHGDRYATFAGSLVGAGYAVYASDLRGHGRSAGRRVTVDSFDDYLDDLDLYVERVAKEQPGRRIFLFGHSMGGAIVARYAEERPSGIAGIILSAAALRLDVPPIAIPFALLAGDLLPNFGGLKLDDDDFSSDPQVVRDMRADPFITDGPGPAHTAGELLLGIHRIWDGLDALTVPILALHGSADRVTNPGGSERLVDDAPATDRTFHLYQGFRHDLLHEPGGPQVVADVLTWLDARAAGPLPPQKKWVTDYLPGGPTAVSLTLDGRWRHGSPDLGDAALSTRVFLGAYCLGADAGGGPHTFDGQLYATGLALRFDGSFVSLCAGAGGTLLGESARVLFDVPVELRAELQLGPIRLVAAGRALWIPANKDVQWSGLLALRLGDDRAYWPPVSASSGPIVGLTAEKDARGGWVGVLLGIHFWGG